ncbi:hypothetical protein RRG08_046115 [Elysia crispata]|uniref:Uncharacterized protein n=1 Tax=Elysia crispata TaxID=231223 RepID=A0AAE0YH77_9GAST|nr:hypothetical protein RRG08_046115 [Elysia crispata]
MLPKRKKNQILEKASGKRANTCTRRNATQEEIKRSNSQESDLTDKKKRSAVQNKERLLEVSLDANRCGIKEPMQSATQSRRSSTRLQQKSSTTPIIPFLVDSAYDGDEESSPSTTQSEEDDPYSVATMEDVPAVSRERKKKREKRPVPKATKAKITKRTSSACGHTSSTPNQIVEPPVRRSTRHTSRLSSTPEVTPILPVKSIDILYPDVSFTTPQLGCKQSEAVSSASPSLQSSSQADSGIALSPPAKRARLQPGEARHKSATVLGKKFMNKRNIFSPNSKEKQNECEAKENVDNSCFGFNSLESVALEHQRDILVTEVYRSVQPVMTDSSPSRPLVSTDSENCLGSQCQWPSPSLFSDDMLSADAESTTFNKSTARSYKPCKEKKLKHKKAVSKFEAWANEINMEIEDIERFVLNIE